MRKQTNENTIESVSSTLLSDFVSEVPTILDRTTGTANPIPPGPLIKDEATQKPKRAIFSSLIWGGDVERRV